MNQNKSPAVKMFEHTLKQRWKYLRHLHALSDRSIIRMLRDCDDNTITNIIEEIQETNILARILDLLEVDRLKAILELLDTHRVDRCLRCLNDHKRNDLLHLFSENERAELSQLVNAWQDLEMFNFPGRILPLTIISTGIPDHYPANLQECNYCGYNYEESTYVWETLYAVDCGKHSYHEYCTPEPGICDQCPGSP